MKDLLISIWIRTPGDAEASGDSFMPQNNITIRLHCSLDNGKHQWGPGDCVNLPEPQARELLDMDLAETVETVKTDAPSAKTETDSGTSEGGANG